MQTGRPVFALNPRLFGKGPVRELASPQPAQIRISDDLKLFATTFLAGFIFVSILIG